MKLTKKQKWALGKIDEQVYFSMFNEKNKIVPRRIKVESVYFSSRSTRFLFRPSMATNETVLIDQCFDTEGQSVNQLRKDIIAKFDAALSNADIDEDGI